LRRKIFVAIEDDNPVGTMGIKKDERGGKNDYVFVTVFVLPEKHGSGIGRLLIEKGEEYVHSLGGSKITIPATITAHMFYYKMGYRYVDPSKKPNQENIILMVKEFL
jgi:GNAT superfamily N-acetyltransferase